MNSHNTEQANQNFSILNHTRALYSCAKDRKKTQWLCEISASLLSLGTSLVPWWQASALLLILCLASKVLAKSFSSEGKTLFRRAERFRRYDFEARTLGWPVPPRERADMHVSNSEIESYSKKWGERESGYYSNESPPSDIRLFSNLAESIFWSERLMSKMASRRSKQFFLAFAASATTLLATVLIQPGESAALVIKFLAIGVSLLVTLDMHGEARSFQRGEKELAQILTALTTDGQNDKVRSNEVMRFFIEYNCLLADLPLIPDEIYNESIPELNQAWTAFRSGVAILHVS